MTDETSGSPRPQARHVMGAAALLRRARNNPAAARHVQNIAKAAAKGHPGAALAQAAIAEARKQQRQAPTGGPSSPPAPLAALSPMLPVSRSLGRPSAFPAWARGAA